jgi:hypothetical protein
MFTTSSSAATGLANYATNTLGRLNGTDSVAAALLKLWSAAALNEDSP